MATNVKPATKICMVCKRTPWFGLPPEDGPGVPHYATHAALAECVRTSSCDVCPLLLKAAISHYTHHQNVRYGKGFWRQFDIRHYADANGAARKVSRFTSFGSCVPAEARTAPSQLSGGVMAPTGIIRMEGEHMNDGLADLDHLTLEDIPLDLPVWLYGNWWSDGEASERDKFKFMGIGVRFGTSASHFDAFGTEAGNLQLNGSLIRVGVDDGNGEYP